MATSANIAPFGPGRFISLEGGEGVGKSTLMRYLVAELNAKKIEVVSTFEPGGSPMAQKVRQLFVDPPADDPIRPFTELMLISAARHQHVEHVIRPALTRGAWVLCDRFTDSTRVYQGAFGGIASEFLESVVNHSTHGLVPDLTFLLDCPVAVAEQRMLAHGDVHAAQRTGARRYDNAQHEVHERLRRAYLDIAARSPGRIVILDASGDTHSVQEQAWQTLRAKFAELGP